VIGAAKEALGCRRRRKGLDSRVSDKPGHQRARPDLSLFLTEMRQVPSKGGARRVLPPCSQGKFSVS
jgi:hypothetical protein